MKSKISIFWFRRDLRLHDNAGLYRALRAGTPVVPLFIFDRHILDKLNDKSDPRVTFIHDTLTGIQKELKEHGSNLVVKYGEPEQIWEHLIKNYDIDTVFTNRDYETYAKTRDAKVEAMLLKKGAQFKSFKDHVIFDTDEVLKKDGTPYTVFTPYSKVWKTKAESRAKDNITDSYYFKSYPSMKYADHLAKEIDGEMPSLEDMGFARSNLAIPEDTVTQGLIKSYSEKRNFPAVNGTSRLGLHFRFGTISIREKAKKASKLNETFLSELIWRDFYSNILNHFPHVEKEPFRAKYKAIEWVNNEEDFAAWKKGETGFPIVDAGMRELNNTGYMHNRVRMIVASFLTKHLLIDWKWGEAYFAEKLLDFDLASNNGGWQWAAGCGTDAAPYFRIFNPYTQQQKFDKQFEYINKWVPEYGTDAYPEAIVDHKEARARCLEVYKSGLDNN